jgi:hypothetical protein
MSLWEEDEYEDLDRYLGYRRSGAAVCRSALQKTADIMTAATSPHWCWCQQIDTGAQWFTSAETAASLLLHTRNAGHETLPE